MNLLKLKFPVKNLGRQLCTEGFNSGVKGLIVSLYEVLVIHCGNHGIFWIHFYQTLFLKQNLLQFKATFISTNSVKDKSTDFRSFSNKEILSLMSDNSKVANKYFSTHNGTCFIHY
jgi:hypothetical protein